MKTKLTLYLYRHSVGEKDRFNSSEAVPVYGCLSYVHNGTHVAIPTMENGSGTRPDGIPYIIPDGTYRCTTHPWPKHNRDVVEVMDVPHRSGIFIHSGTKPDDSLGCILTTYGLESNKAFTNVIVQLCALGYEVELQVSSNTRDNNLTCITEHSYWKHYA